MGVWAQDDGYIRVKGEMNGVYDGAYGQVNRLSGRAIINVTKRGDLIQQYDVDCRRLQQKF